MAISRHNVYSNQVCGHFEHRRWLLPGRWRRHLVFLLRESRNRKEKKNGRKENNPDGLSRNERMKDSHFSVPDPRSRCSGNLLLHDTRISKFLRLNSLLVYPCLRVSLLRAFTSLLWDSEPRPYRTLFSSLTINS